MSRDALRGIVFVVIGPVVGAIIVLLLNGCGGSAKTSVVPVGIPRASAIRPDGYTPEAPPTKRTLTGNAIKLSHHGAQFIESFEGFSSCVYYDRLGGVYTRGYGETEGIGPRSPCISRAYGERNLIYRAERFYGFAIKRLGTSFNQNEIDAQFSFLWNLGAGIDPPGSSLAHAFQRHDPSPILAYARAGGQFIPGLYRRRLAEAHLFRTPAHEETRAHRKARLHAELGRAKGQLKREHDYLARHRCRKAKRPRPRPLPRTRAQKRLCAAVKANGNATHGRIDRLHREGAR